MSTALSAVIDGRPCLSFLCKVWSDLDRLQANLESMAANPEHKWHRTKVRQLTAVTQSYRRTWQAWERTNPVTAARCMAEAPAEVRSVFEFLRKVDGVLP